MGCVIVAILLLYFLVEALAFWAVAHVIGVLWASLALIILTFLGIAYAMSQTRRLRLGGRGSGGRAPRTPQVAAADIGSVVIGTILVSVPGFVSTLVGLLCLIPATRRIPRAFLARKLQARIDRFTNGIYANIAKSGPKTSYGSFVVNEPKDDASESEDIHRWSQQVRPEDFGKGHGPEQR